MRLNKNVQFIIAVSITNLIGYLLKYFSISPVPIILGLRFHISILFPFLLMANHLQLQNVRENFVNTGKIKISIALGLIMLSAAFIMLSALLFGLLQYNDPEYLFEFGLSSVIDFPIYLLWNLPQLFMLYFITAFINRNINKLSAKIVVLFSPLIFEVIFLIKEENYSPILLIAATPALIIIISRKISNIYWFAIIIFSFYWLNNLLWGTKSEEIVNILFAASYNAWEGMFSVKYLQSDYLMFVSIGLTVFILSSVPDIFLLKKDK